MSKSIDVQEIQSKLEWPFDNEWILSNRRALKRALSEKEGLVTKKIAILGGSTTNDIAVILALFLMNYGIKPEFYQSEYAQYWQDAMFDNPELKEFAPDIIFIHTTNRNITAFPALTDEKERIDALLNEQFEHFRVMWDKLLDTYHCPIIQNNFEPPLYRLLGNKDVSDIHGKTNFTAKLNMKFYEYAETHENFYINDINYLAASYGLSRWSDPGYWYMYKYALALEAIPEFAFNVANIIKSIYGKNKKILALDLDNTLWGGVVGDDGVNGLELGPETATGQAYGEFQSYVKEFKQLGVLLTVCSKNDEENAVAGLNHPDGALKPDDFTVIKANWETKDLNLSNTASELNLLPESIAFVDDNPAERTIVRAQLPGAAVPEIGTVEEYIRCVDRSGFFEVTSLSKDDLKRGEMYKANAERQRLEKQYENYEDYLRSLEMKGEIAPFAPVYLQRIAQLTNKSNQFNVTTKRYTAAEIEALAEDDSHICLYGRLVDKFGDNGVVSVVIGRLEGKEMHMELWLMSCRVLKRDMELAMLDTVVEEAKKRGVEQIYGYYYPTAKNKMVKELYAHFGFDKQSEDEAGNTVWKLETADYSKRCHVIAINE
ncbi:MAG: HAD-IIIC family phosphatase [Ruminococcaceae bacterium]|nr:HAD-IIIC family phosphatase [Oscillospiraceae bacterium]